MPITRADLLDERNLRYEVEAERDRLAAEVVALRDAVGRPHVRVDPAMRSGRPAVRGVPCEALVEALGVGASVAEVADDYSLSRAEVLVAAWYLGLYGTRQWRRKLNVWAMEAGGAMWVGNPDYGAIPDPPLGGRKEGADRG